MNTKAKAATNETETAVAVVTKSSAVAMPDFMGMEDMDGGFEGTDSESYAIPFLQILQKMSPLVDENNPAYVTGAKAGMLYNTVTKQLFDGKAGVLLIPCSYKRSYIQWGGREGDGGFKGEFTPEQIIEMQSNGEITTVEGRLYKTNPDGSPINEKKADYYADTRSHYVLVLDEVTGQYGRAILSLASTQVKASKNLMTSLSQKKVATPKGNKTPPTFANVVRLSTLGVSNDKGSWSAAVFNLESLVTDPELFNEAKAFYLAVNTGEVKADHAKSASEATGNAAPSETPTDAEQF